MIKHVIGFWHFLRSMHRRIDRANLPLVAAGGAFFSMLSLFPGLAAVIAVLGFFADPNIVDEQLNILSDFIPEDALSLLDGQIQRLAATNSSTLGWTTAISTAAALWSARRGTDAMIRAMNSVHNTPMRGGIWSALAALIITFVLILVVVVALLTMVVIPVVMALLPLGTYTGMAAEYGRWAVGIFVVFTGIWVLYRFAPNGPAARVGLVNPGAILAVVFWGAATWGFSYYLANFGSYNEIYGSIGAVIALLMFLYLTILIVLLGAALNAELHVNGQSSDPPDAVEVGTPAAVPGSPPTAEG